MIATKKYMSIMEIASRILQSNRLKNVPDNIKECVDLAEELYEEVRKRENETLFPTAND